MQAAAVVETGEQVLADAAHAQHGAARQVVLDQAGMAQLPAQEQLPGERRVQALPGEVDGVALGHVPTVTRGRIVVPGTNAPVRGAVWHRPRPAGRAGTVWRRGEEVA